MAMNSSKGGMNGLEETSVFEEEKGTYELEMLTLYDHPCSKRNLHPARIT
jgi:hypothetical protein